jgi:hypothetical protein
MKKKISQISQKGTDNNKIKSSVLICEDKKENSIPNCLTFYKWAFNSRRNILRRCKD